MDTWNKFINKEKEKEYFFNIEKVLKEEEAKGIEIYPTKDNRFKALESTQFESTKVVILGQDPYFNPGEAMGLSFSVPKGKAIPSSLRNIFKEIQSDTGKPTPTHGDLTNWTKQGVLLLNTALTVRKKERNSHEKIGWTNFTDNAIKHLSDSKENLVFILWGANARKRKPFINVNKHLILECAHPSGLSAHRGFYGCKHFTKTNNYLKQNGITEIDWTNL